MSAAEASDVPMSQEAPPHRRRPVRRRRHRTRALVLASLGWTVCAAAAAMLAALSPATPLALLGIGVVLLSLCMRGRGDVPLAAVGVGASGVVASLVAAAAVVGDPARALPPLAITVVVVGLAIGLPSFAARAAAMRSTRLRWAALAVALGVGGLGVASFPAHRTIEVRVLDGDIAPWSESDGAPSMGALAARSDLGRIDVVRIVEEGLAPVFSGPRFSRRDRTLPVAIVAMWAVGLALALAGAVLLRRTLRELTRLEGAVRVRRTHAGFLLDDGDAVVLDREPEDDEALAVVERKGAHYRTSARITGVVVGTGSLAQQCEALRRQLVTVAVGTAVTAGAAWLPLMVLTAHG